MIWDVRYISEEARQIITGPRLPSNYGLFDGHFIFSCYNIHVVCDGPVTYPGDTNILVKSSKGRSGHLKRIFIYVPYMLYIIFTPTNNEQYMHFLF